MKKALAIYEYSNAWCECVLIGIHLDVEKGMSWVEAKNTSYEEEFKIQQECYLCHKEDAQYLYKGACKRASIKTDRHGEYCENELSYYDIKSSRFSGVEIDIIE